MAINIMKRKAKPISYGGKRSCTKIKYIVIHYTGNRGDTAKNNLDFFATSNTREAGAHYFVDSEGKIGESIPISYVAYAVGGFYSSKHGAGTYYKKCTNFNSVSIELCNCTKGVTWEQMLAVRELVQYIQTRCPHAKTILRHWDVNGKDCPGPMTGKKNKKWKHLKNKIVHNYQYKAKVRVTAAIRSSKGVKKNNKIWSAKRGQVVEISKVVGGWGRLLQKKGDKYQWISLAKVKEL